MKKQKLLATLYAFLAAVFYAISAPFSKRLLENISPTYLAALLYLGAGIGVAIMYLINKPKASKDETLTREDLPYTIAMIVLDILAPICLMVGIQWSQASSASLIGNFEIVATTVIAMGLFKEQVSRRLWFGIIWITLSCIILSFTGVSSIRFSIGSIFVVMATLLWGLENNCTRRISDKSPYAIVVLKGVFSGGGAFVIAKLLGEHSPRLSIAALAMLLGFIAYGLSIFVYIQSQRILGAAKTSAYYAVAPFIGAILALIINREPLTPAYFIAFMLMLIGASYVIKDTLATRHSHRHEHIVVHYHNGKRHSHSIVHSHGHDHFLEECTHRHIHGRLLLGKVHGSKAKDTYVSG